MNQKKAKMLRRMARENTIGKPDVSYDGYISKHDEVNKVDKYRLELQPGCTRHELNEQKKKYKTKQ